MEKEVIQVEIPAGKKAAWVDGFLKLVDAEEEQKKDERPITERVKTFEDACKELGEDHKLVQQFKAIQEAIAEDKEATAYFKLGIITAALNEGWEPDFTNDDEYRYYPYLCLWTKEELEVSDDKRGNQKILRAQTVESNLPKSFNVNMPIFKGTEKRTFEVEVEINPNDLSCTLVSQEAHDIVVQERDNQMDAVLGRIGDAAPNIVIIEQ